jgi:predicted nuclease of predicted toxin-antitoxin system
MMLWLDAHLSPRLAGWITTRFGLIALPVRDVGLREADDADIWEAARQAGAVLLTKDGDFEERVNRLGPPPHIVWLTCGNTSEARLQEILELHLPSALELIQQGEALVEIN